MGRESLSSYGRLNNDLAEKELQFSKKSFTWLDKNFIYAYCTGPCGFFEDFFHSLKFCIFVPL